MNPINLPVGKANLEVFGQTLIELGGRDPDILVVTSDSRGSGRVGPFAEKFPDQLIELGIAEQNLVGVAAGLAAAGKKVLSQRLSGGRKVGRHGRIGQHRLGLGQPAADLFRP